jgi:heptosyltransferase-1
LKILIVKLSSLGDVVHAMPVLADIFLAHPQAQIDWVVERGFAPLLQRCQGIHRVVECELRSWRKAPLASSTRQAWRVFKSELQQERYDAVLDLQGLTKSAWIAWLSQLAPGGKRIALANQTEGSSYEAPTRWVADQSIALPAHIHAVARSREICARALGYTLPSVVNYGFAPVSVQESEQGLAALSVRREGRPVVALVHGTSRADKQWPVTHWLDLGQRLNAAGFDLVLPYGSEVEQQRSNQIAQGLAHATVLPRLGLDALTDALAQCAGVIGVDSGLSHIAVALDLPHVQIYNFDTAWRTGPLRHGGPMRQLSVYASPTPGVDAVWQAWRTVMPTSP